MCNKKVGKDVIAAKSQQMRSRKLLLCTGVRYKHPTSDLHFPQKVPPLKELPTPRSQGFTQEMAVIHLVVHTFIPNPFRFCQRQVGGFTREHRRTTQ